MAQLVTFVDSDEEWRDEPSVSYDEKDLRDESLLDNASMMAHDRLSEFSHLQSQECYLTAKELTLKKIEAIEKLETIEAHNLRFSKNYRMSKDLISLQENNIRTAFAEVNHLRAEIANLCFDKSLHTLQKFYVSRYAHASLKEISARKHYAKLSLASAHETKLQRSNFCDDWIFRIHNNSIVVEEYTKMLAKPELNQTLQLRKKHEFEYHRAKAIHKADIKAFTAVWPHIDYNECILQQLVEAQRQCSISELSVHIADDLEDIISNSGSTTL